MAPLTPCSLTWSGSEALPPALGVGALVKFVYQPARADKFSFGLWNRLQRVVLASDAALDSIVLSPFPDHGQDCIVQRTKAKAASFRFDPLSIGKELFDIGRLTKADPCFIREFLHSPALLSCGEENAEDSFGLGRVQRSEIAFLYGRIGEAFAADVHLIERQPAIAGEIEIADLEIARTKP